MIAQAEKLQSMERSNLNTIQGQSTAVKDLLQAIKISFALESCTDREQKERLIA
jgi:ATP-dependent Clp protease ATP-binding subunit ClpA